MVRKILSGRRNGGRQSNNPLSTVVMYEQLFAVFQVGNFPINMLSVSVSVSAYFARANHGILGRDLNEKSSILELMM